MSRIPDEVLRRVKSSLTAYAGLELPDWVLASRLTRRVKALGMSDSRAYAELITTDAGLRERELLVEALRVGETRFFRHRSHVAALTDLVIPALRASKTSGEIRAWSAGCASGEEAYTLAMVLRKLMPRAYEVRVLASDISTDALEVGRRAVYPEAALSHVPDAYRSCFSPAAKAETGADQYSIDPAIAALVDFQRCNLADGGFRRGFDIVWCRNVLIYFSPEVRQLTLERLVGSLNEDGFLFLGYAETLRGFDRIEAVRAPDAVLYRKCPARPPAARPRALSEAAPVFRRRTPPSLPAVSPQEVVIELRGRYQDGSRLSRELAAIMSTAYRAAIVDLDGAEFLSEAAAAVLRRARSAARAAGMSLEFVAHRPGHQRFLRRAGLAEAGDKT